MGPGGCKWQAAVRGAVGVGGVALCCSLTGQRDNGGPPGSPHSRAQQGGSVFSPAEPCSPGRGL